MDTCNVHNVCDCQHHTNQYNVWYINAKYTPKKVSCNYLSIIVNKKLNYLKACRLPSSDNLIEL